MHIPMEILSQMTAGTGSGRGTQAPRAGPGDGKAGFQKAFERELDRHDQKMLKKEKVPDGDAAKTKSQEGTRPGEVKNKDGPKDNTDEALAAGVNSLAGDISHQEVVFILEGEESVTTPEIRVEGQPATEPDAGVPNEETVNTDTAKTEETQGTPHAESNAKAEFKEVFTAKADEAAQASKENAAGEVTARTPEVKPEDGQHNDRTGGNLKDNGNPSRLENENENAYKTAEVKDEETYAKEAVARAAESSERKPADKADGPAEKKQAMPAASATATEPPPTPLSMGIKTEQFMAKQQMTQAAAQHPVKPENLFQEMISRVETSLTAEKNTMTIQLNPEYLGKVALEVGMDASGLHVKINAEDNGVRGMINAQLSTLIESLQSKGIAVANVEVVFAGANFDNFSGADSGKHESKSQGHPERQAGKVKETIQYYTTITDLMDFYMDVGRSSVEYRA